MSEQKEFTLKSYNDYLKNGKIMGSKCGQCGKVFLPPRKFCNECFSNDMEWIEFSGKGKVETYALINVGARYFTNQGYNMKTPYCFGTVKLEEGPSISGHIVGENKQWEGDPDNFEIGMDVKAKVLEVEDPKRDKTNFDLGFTPV